MGPIAQSANLGTTQARGAAWVRMTIGARVQRLSRDMGMSKTTAKWTPPVKGLLQRNEAEVRGYAVGPQRQCHRLQAVRTRVERKAAPWGPHVGVG